MTNILSKSMSVYIIKIITRAVLLCAEQEIALRGHRGQDSSNDVRKKSDTERTMQRNNFFSDYKCFCNFRHCINGIFRKKCSKRQNGIMTNSKSHC